VFFVCRVIHPIGPMTTRVVLPPIMVIRFRVQGNDLYRLPKIMSIWPSEWENPNGSPATAFPLSFLRKQESRIWAPDQVRGDGVILPNRKKPLATAITLGGARLS
jgi:hypothetical protein